MSGAPWLGLSVSSEWTLLHELARLLAEPDAPGRDAFVAWVEAVLDEREQITRRLRAELHERGAA